MRRLNLLLNKQRPVSESLKSVSVQDKKKKKAYRSADGYKVLPCWTDDKQVTSKYNFTSSLILFHFVEGNFTEFNGIFHHKAPNV